MVIDFDAEKARREIDSEYQISSALEEVIHPHRLSDELKHTMLGLQEFDGRPVSDLSMMRIALRALALALHDRGSEIEDAKQAIAECVMSFPAQPREDDADID